MDEFTSSLMGHAAMEPCLLSIIIIVVVSVFSITDRDILNLAHYPSKSLVAARLAWL